MARIDTFILGAALLSGLFACSGGKGPSSVDEILGSGTTGGSSASSGSQDGPGDGSGPTSSAVPGGSGGNFLNVDTFPLDLIVSGGVGRDGIPALTDPRFVSATSADARYIADSDPVMGVVIGGEAKAYPHNIGWWHEIVNDKIAN